MNIWILIIALFYTVISKSSNGENRCDVDLLISSTNDFCSSVIADVRLMLDGNIKESSNINFTQIFEFAKDTIKADIASNRKFEELSIQEQSLWKRIDIAKIYIVRDRNDFYYPICITRGTHFNRAVQTLIVCSNRSNSISGIVSEIGHELGHAVDRCSSNNEIYSFPKDKIAEGASGINTVEQILNSLYKETINEENCKKYNSLMNLKTLLGPTKVLGTNLTHVSLPISLLLERTVPSINAINYTDYPYKDVYNCLRDKGFYSASESDKKERNARFNRAQELAKKLQESRTAKQGQEANTSMMIPMNFVPIYPSPFLLFPPLKEIRSVSEEWAIQCIPPPKVYSKITEANEPSELECDGTSGHQMTEIIADHFGALVLDRHFAQNPDLELKSILDIFSSSHWIDRCLESDLEREYGSLTHDHPKTEERVDKIYLTFPNIRAKLCKSKTDVLQQKPVAKGTGTIQCLHQSQQPSEKRGAGTVH